ncbi:hypothetical protein C8J57DRAFT_1114502 [Mycena rebaudengoi]|nr:hypothetical protein C8J57DRAFT_1114502 [Mycena rebaudengoi]
MRSPFQPDGSGLPSNASANALMPSSSLLTTTTFDLRAQCGPQSADYTPLPFLDQRFTTSIDWHHGDPDIGAPTIRTGEYSLPVDRAQRVSMSEQRAQYPLLHGQGMYSQTQLHRGYFESHARHSTFRNGEPSMTINGGTFVGGNINNVHRSAEGGIHILHRAVALQAMHDSADNLPQPRCHPETREEMLKKLWKWSTKSEWSDRFSEGLPVLWLHGPAGAGKSALMRTLAERLEQAGRLGGSFFFKRGHATRGNAEMLFATLAYQLALNLATLKTPISQIVEDSPYLVAKSIHVQLQKLIVEPCRSLDMSQAPTIIIDGLDECGNPHVQQDVLRAIGNAIREHSPPLRFLIASRPEPHIWEMFQGSSFKGLHNSFNVEQSFADVEKYFRDEFTRIHREHHQTMADVSRPWPSDDVIARHVRKSSGYFIYAKIVINFVDDKNFRPTERLEHLWECSHSESPFGALDQLYMQILSTAPARSRLLPILRAMAFFRFKIRTSAIEELLELNPGDVQLTLRGLHSVLAIPEHEDDTWEPIRVHHASFDDFLNDPKRAGEFYVGDLQHRVDLSRRLFVALSHMCTHPPINRTGGPLGLSPEIADVIIDIPPLTEFVPLIWLIKPTFIFYASNGMPERMLSLLKNIENVPRALIELWEDYQFMKLFDSAIYDWSSWPPDTSVVSANASEQLKRCPRLLRIFHVYLLGDKWEHLDLVCIHVLLDISWDDLRVAICSLRPIVGIDRSQIRALIRFVGEHRFSETSIAILSSDLARGCIRFLKDAVMGLQPCRLILNCYMFWGRFVRSSPHSAALLHDICQFPSFDSLREIEEDNCHPENYHNVLQWLKAFPGLPPDTPVIDIWQHYLMDACRSDKWLWTDNPHYDIENGWREWQNYKKMKFPNTIPPVVWKEL